jgi:hypothetical protein
MTRKTVVYGFHLRSDAIPKLSDTRVPKYCRHRASGQAIVTLDGQDIYLGKYGSAASKAEYNRLIAEWLAAGRHLPRDPDAITVGEVVAAHHRHAQQYYRLPDGRPTSEVDNFIAAMTPLLKLYKRLPAVEFSPLKLKAVQSDMVKLKWCRSSINKHTGRIKAVFRCLSLFGECDHRLLADHLTAEYRQQTQGRGRTVDEWRLRTPGRDNHWLDCLVGCAAGASMLGAVLDGTARRVRPVKRIRLSELQKTSKVWRPRSA